MDNQPENNKIKCTSCKKTKSEDDFKQKKNGTRCRQCLRCAGRAKKSRDANKAKIVAYRQKNKTRAKETDRIYRERKKEELIEYRKKRYNENQDKYKQKAKQYYKENAERVKAYARARNQDPEVKARVKAYNKMYHAQRCEHNRKPWNCVDCGGSQTCEHKTQTKCCKICSPIGHITGVVRSRIHNALGSDKKNGTIEYLGCDAETFRFHIEEQFVEGMSWDNYGEWQIDHIIPLQYDSPSIEEVIERLDYLNTQPLWAVENQSKGNRRIG